MQLFIVALVVIVVGLTLLFCTRQPKRAESAYTTLEKSRKTIGAVALVLISYTFLRSGDPMRISAAVIMIVLAVIYVFVEQPHKEIV